MMDIGTSRDEVKERLWRIALEAWDMSDMHVGRVDPLVNLIFGALALEVERIGHTIYDSDARIFEHLARHLLPEVLVLAEPAHAVVKLFPSGRMTVTRFDELYFEQTIRRKENMNRPETREHGFSVAGDIRTTNLRLICRAVGTELELVEGTRRRPVAPLRMPVAPQAMYLGFAGDHADEDEIQLYFDWPGHPARDRCIAAVQRISVHDHAGTPLRTEAGLPVWDAEEHQIGDRHHINVLEKRVRAFYQRNFLRIRTGPINTVLPPELEGLPKEIGGVSTSSVVWLRIDLPSDIGPDLIAAALVLENCAPVINRSLRKAIFRLQPDLNIKRLDANGAFLGMEKAENGTEQVYLEVPSTEQVDITPGTYTIRHGATARFDERDGTQLLQHTMDQIREESRAFASLDVSSTLSDLRSINQSISRIERRLREVEAGKARTYVVMRPFDSSETAHLHFWTTEAEEANGIPPGTTLRSKHSGLGSGGMVQLISPTVGGREKRSHKELVHMYRSTVLGRGRIATRRDIMEHCRTICGVRLCNVAIKDGLMLAPEPSKGLVRCLDVQLTFEQGSVSASEAEYFRERLQADLNTSSALSLPIRVQ